MGAKGSTVEQRTVRKLRQELSVPASSCSFPPRRWTDWNGLCDLLLSEAIIHVMPLMPLASSAARSYIRKKKSLGPFHLSGLATATGLEIKPMFSDGPAGPAPGPCWGLQGELQKESQWESTGKWKGDHSGNQSGNCTGNCNGNHSEKCAGSCKMNCSHCGNWTGRCSGSCIGNHTENCKGNCDGNSSGSCPPAAGEPIKFLSMALNLSLGGKGQHDLLQHLWVVKRGQLHYNEPPLLPGLARHGGALASTREALWAGTLRMLEGCPVAKPLREVGDPLQGGWQLSSELCSWPALRAWPHISYCLIICVSNQK